MEHLVELLEQRLVPRTVPPHPDGGRQAAVAIILHDRPEGPHVLLMKRAERAGDPWSGHISLPGGGYEPGDGDLVATAIRETHEELGVDLATARVLGALPPLHPRSSGPNGVLVTPVVFVTASEPQPVCGPQALAAFWLPLTRAAAGVYDGTFTYREAASGRSFPLPSWDYEGHVIWGLTFRILQDVMSAAHGDFTPAG